MHIIIIDDVLYSGKIPEDYLAKLEAVFAREKCYFMLLSVQYLGFKISAEGL